MNKIITYPGICIPNIVERLQDMFSVTSTISCLAVMTGPFVLKVLSIKADKI